MPSALCGDAAVRPAAIAATGNDPEALSALFEADLDAQEGSLRIKGEVALTSQAVRDRGLLSLACQLVVGAYAEERPRAISGLGISEVAAVATAVIAVRGADVVITETQSARDVPQAPTGQTPALQARNHAATAAR